VIVKTTRMMAACAVALVAMTSSVAMAQGRGQGRGKTENRGQAKKAERQAAARFADHDRQVANNWYVHNRQSLPPGLRDRDRLPPGQEQRVQPGYVFDRGDRQRVYPAPAPLVRGFAPPPPGYRYVTFGGHIVLVDNGYRVADVIRLEINIGR
jgi:Ni/Co efflux regulator RcnB